MKRGNYDGAPSEQVQTERVKNRKWCPKSCALFGQKVAKKQKKRETSCCSTEPSLVSKTPPSQFSTQC